jgi:hypothetical protein
MGEAYSEHGTENKCKILEGNHSRKGRPGPPMLRLKNSNNIDLERIGSGLGSFGSGYGSVWVLGSCNQLPGFIKFWQLLY